MQGARRLDVKHGVCHIRVNLCTGGGQCKVDQQDKVGLTPRPHAFTAAWNTLSSSCSLVVEPVTLL